MGLLCKNIFRRLSCQICLLLLARRRVNPPKSPLRVQTPHPTPSPVRMCVCPHPQDFVVLRPELSEF